MNKRCKMRQCLAPNNLVLKPSTAPESDIRKQLPQNQSPNLNEETKSTNVIENNKTRWRNGEPPRCWVGGTYICEVCEKDCGYYNNLRMHRNRKHGLTKRYVKEINEKKCKNSEPPPFWVKGTFNCGVCEKDFGYLINLKMHQRQMHGHGHRMTSKLKRSMPCYKCSGCNNVDCLTCKWCYDKKKYGGPGKLNKRCINRRCLSPVTQYHQYVRQPCTQRGELPERQLYVAAGGQVKSMPCQWCRNCRYK